MTERQSQIRLRKEKWKCPGKSPQCYKFSDEAFRIIQTRCPSHEPIASTIFLCQFALFKLTFLNDDSCSHICTANMNSAIPIELVKHQRNRTHYNIVRAIIFCWYTKLRSHPRYCTISCDPQTVGRLLSNRPIIKCWLWFKIVFAERVHKDTEKS
jgi:hypothetical protein